MTISTEVPVLQPSRIPEIVLARMLALLESLGCLTCSLLLLKVVPIFGGLFLGIHADLPFATRLLVTHYGGIAALFVGGGVVFPIVMEFLNLDTRRRLIIAGTFVAATSAFVPLLVLSMYLPLFELIRKLGQAK